MEHKCAEPILLLLFNRPDYTQKLIEALDLIKPQNLFVVIDGPRNGNESDAKKVKLCKDIIDSVEWGGKKTVLARSENYGCGKGVSAAITWFFEHVSRGIILEDDCIPSQSFFTFCSTMLERYENNPRVMHISGTRWSEEFHITTSYFFSSIGHIWGWATWKRAWEHYDFDMNGWKEFKLSQTLHTINPDPAFKKYWIKTFDHFLQSEHKNTWDYQWQYTLFDKGGLAVVPSENLISNIGESGVHSATKQLNVHQRRTSNDFKIKETLIQEVVNKEFDAYHVKFYFQKKPPFFKRIRIKLSYLLNNLK